MTPRPHITATLRQLRRQRDAWCAAASLSLAAIASFLAFTFFSGCSVYDDHELEQGTVPYFNDPACADAAPGTWCNPIEVTPRCSVLEDLEHHEFEVSGDCDAGVEHE